MTDQPLAPGLYLVATPIGNLEDITLRALRVLKSATKIACEDTRQTQKLLNHYEIQTPTTSYHDHNEAEKTAQLLEELKQGAAIALVSDAGTPAISDPGSVLTNAAIAAQIPVYPIPGANAALAALIASGLPNASFHFQGFLPAKAGARLTQLERLAAQLTEGEAQTLVFYEAPHRILETLAAIEQAFGPEAKIVLARELTKLHEEFLRGSAPEIRQMLAERNRIRGEMVLLVEAQAGPAKPQTATLAERVAQLQTERSLTEMEALKRAARERNLPKSQAYRELQRERSARK